MRWGHAVAGPVRDPGGAGVWGRCDPRARLLATVAAAGTVWAATSWGEIAVGLTAVALVHLLSGTGPGAALAALRPFRFLLAFTLIVTVALTGGTPVPHGAPAAPFSCGSCAAAAKALLRLCGVIAASAHLVRTTCPLSLARSLGWCIAPTSRLGVPVREVTLVMAIGFHFFPVLLDESRQIRSALESRGISLFHPLFRQRARALLAWTLAVLFGMVERSAHLAAALAARGFALPRTRGHRFRPWRLESTCLVVASLALGALTAVFSR